jgi:hypothetical protein
MCQKNVVVALKNWEMLAIIDRIWAILSENKPKLEILSPGIEFDFPSELTLKFQLRFKGRCINTKRALPTFLEVN